MEEEFSQSLDISTIEHMIREHTAFPSVFTVARRHCLNMHITLYYPRKFLSYTQKRFVTSGLAFCQKLKTKQKEIGKHGCQDEF